MGMTLTKTDLEAMILEAVVLEALILEAVIIIIKSLIRT
jgi:hypothetical protein